MSTAASPAVFGPRSISLRLYPHEAPPADVVRILARQATVAVDNGFDGVLISEGHGVRTNVPNPLQVTGWLLEAMPTGWAAPCPLLLPLRPALIVAEEVAWLGARFPGRVGIGVAVGGHRDQFEALGQSFDRRVDRFRAELPLLVDALVRGAGPLAGDAAVARCREHPIPVVSAALSPAAVERAVHAGAGIVGDSLTTPERTCALLARYTKRGGTGPRVVIRRVWIGTRPSAREAEQLAWYRAAAPASARKFWGDADQTILEPTGEGVAARLLELLDDLSSPEPPALNLRVHVSGLAPEAVEEQVVRLGEEVLPRLRAHRPATVTTGSGPPAAQRAG